MAAVQQGEQLQSWFCDGICGHSHDGATIVTGADIQSGAAQQQGFA
jgi:hypothetical protein